MFHKIALMASVLSVVSFSALAQETKMPQRSIPLKEDSARPAAKPSASGHTTMGTPAGVAMTPSDPAPAATPVMPVGSPSFASAGTGASPAAVTPGPNFSAGSTGPDANATATSAAAPAASADPADAKRAEAQDRRSQIIQTNEARLNDTFEEIDTNNDGMVNESEFSLYYKTTGDNPEFIRYDQNNDGQITRQEYMGGNTVGNSLAPPKEPVSTRARP